MKSKAKLVWGVAGVLLVATPLLMVTLYDQESNRRMEAALGEFKRIGYPVTVAELKALEPPPEQNAAPFYLRLFEEVKARKLDKAYKTESRELTADQITFLGQEADFVNRIGEVALRPKLGFNRRYELGANLLLPEYAEMKRLVRMVGSQAELDARRGHEAKSLERLRLMATMASHLEDDPIFIGGLVRMSFLRMRDLTVLKAARERKSVAFRHKLRAELLSHQTLIEVKRHIAGELLYVNSYQGMSPDFHSTDNLQMKLSRLPVVVRRGRAVAAEGLADLARSSQDGLSEQESREIAAMHVVRREKESLSSLMQETLAFFGGTLTDENQREANQILLAAMDLMIEEAGGPKAKIPPTFKVERKGASWAVVGPQWFVAIEGPQTRMGQMTSWQGLR